MAKKRTVKKTVRKRAARTADSRLSSQKKAGKSSSRQTAATGRAKKKAAAKSRTKKKAAKKNRAKKKAAKKSRAKKKTVAAGKARKKAAVKRARRKKTARPMPLGRPRVTLDSKLDELFLKDYEVRQVFEFLNVSTLRELEVHRPAEIVEKLTAPMVQAVGRIRKVLALQKRCLKGDEKFAEKFQQQMQQMQARQS